MQPCRGRGGGGGGWIRVSVCVPHANDVTTFASKLSPHQKVAQCEGRIGRTRDGAGPETGQEQRRSRSRDGALPRNEAALRRLRF